MNPEDREICRKATNEFDQEHIISDIILLGLDGAIRRIKFDVEVED